MRGLLGAARLQLQIVRADRAYLNEILTNPFFAVIFLGVMRSAGRRDLTAHAVVAPVLITVWALALDISGDVVASDRGVGVLEGVVATPVGFPTVVAGRVLAVTALSLVGVAETWLVARVGFGADVTVHHPAALAATLLATVVATTGTATVLAGAFVLTRSARTFQNTMNFPVYLLAGVLVPLSYLPAWLRPLGRLLYLSWSADLLRASLDPDPVPNLVRGLAVILGLGGASFAAGRAVLRIVLDRVRATGMLGVE